MASSVAIASSDSISINDTATLVSNAVIQSSDTIQIQDTADLLSEAVKLTNDKIAFSDVASLMLILPASNMYLYEWYALLDGRKWNPILNRD